MGSFAAPAAEAADATPTACVSVHWAAALGRPYELIAASFGSRVGLFKVLPSSNAAQQQQRLQVSPLQQLVHPAPVWKLEFNALGTTLACSLDGQPEVWLWMPMMDGPWAAVSKLVGGSVVGGGVEADDSLMVD